jgi:hypothetical protein
MNDVFTKRASDKYIVIIFVLDVLFLKVELVNKILEYSLFRAKIVDES